MKVEWMHNETLHSSTPAEQLIKSLRKTETIRAVDPDLGKDGQENQDHQQNPKNDTGPEDPHPGLSAASTAKPVPAQGGIDVVV